MLLLLLACRGPGPTPESPPDSGHSGHSADSAWAWDELHPLPLVEGPPFALPMRLALDPERRRGFVLSLSHSAVAEWDLDSHELVEVHELDGRTSTGRSNPAVDQHGRIWVAGSGTRSIQVRAPGEAFGTVPSDFISAIGAWAHPLGGVVVSGFDANDRPMLVRYDEELEPGDPVFVDDYVVDLVPYGEGLLSLESTASGSRLVARGMDLAASQSCELEVEAHEALEVPEGVLLTGGEATWLSACLEGGEAIVHTQDVGEDDSHAFLLDEGVLVLDRVGEEALEGKAWAVARWLDEELAVTKTVVTGKHSGYGQIDPATGWLWMNSEGTTEVLAMDPDSGVIEAHAQLGTHVEHALPDPDRPGRAWLTGRLSHTLALLDLRVPEVVHSHQELEWPGAPVLVDDRLWLLELLDSRLVEVDPRSLEVLQRHETGLGENATLTFDDLLHHPQRDSFFVSNGATGGLVELDASGELLGSWSFPALAATDSQAVGELELHLAQDGAVLLVQTDLLVLARLDPATGETSERALSQDERHLLAQGYERGFASSEGRLYLGRLAFTQELERAPEHDLDGLYVVAEDEHGLLVRTEEGVEQGERSWSVLSSIGEPHLQLAWEGRLVVPDYGGATVRISEPD